MPRNIESDPNNDDSQEESELELEKKLSGEETEDEPVERLLKQIKTFSQNEKELWKNALNLIRGNTRNPEEFLRYCKGFDVKYPGFSEMVTLLFDRGEIEKIYNIKPGVSHQMSYNKRAEKRRISRDF